MLDLLRDPAWQGIGVVATLLIALVGVFLRRRGSEARQGSEGRAFLDFLRTFFRTFAVCETLFFAGIALMVLGFLLGGTTAAGNTMGSSGLFLVIVSALYFMVLVLVRAVNAASTVFLRRRETERRAVHQHTATNPTAPDRSPTSSTERSAITTPTDTPATVSATSNPVVGQSEGLKSGARITVHSYESPVSLPSWYQRLSPGHELLAIDVEAYAGSNPENYLDHIQLSDFKLQMPNNTRLRPALSAKEPDLGNNCLVHDDYIRGWIAFEVPEGETPRFVIYSRRSSVIKWAFP